MSNFKKYRFMKAANVLSSIFLLWGLVSCAGTALRNGILMDANVLTAKASHDVGTDFQVEIKNYSDMFWFDASKYVHRNNAAKRFIASDCPDAQTLREKPIFSQAGTAPSSWIFDFKCSTR